MSDEQSGTERPVAPIRQAGPRVLGPALHLEDLPTRPPAVVAVRHGPTALDNEIYWQYIGLDDPDYRDGPWWSDGSDLGFGGRPADLIAYANDAAEWMLFAPQEREASE